MHISSSYAKILGEKLFRTWEIPRSGLKAEDGGKKKRNGENNGQPTHGARKHAWRTQAAWAKSLVLYGLLSNILGNLKKLEVIDFWSREPVRCDEKIFEEI